MKNWTRCTSVAYTVWQVERWPRCWHRKTSPLTYKLLWIMWCFFSKVLRNATGLSSSSANLILLSGVFEWLECLACKQKVACLSRHRTILATSFSWAKLFALLVKNSLTALKYMAKTRWKSLKIGILRVLSKCIACDCDTNLRLFAVPRTNPYPSNVILVPSSNKR